VARRADIHLAGAALRILGTFLGRWRKEREREGGDAKVKIIYERFA
jgi:hypothetical protein